MNKLISVIVTVSKGEKHVKRCLKSIISQSYSNLEIIIMDNSVKHEITQIIEGFCKFDSRIRTIKIQQDYTDIDCKLKGVEVAKGDYIAFLQGDDFLSIDFYRTMIMSAEESQSDMVVSDWVYVYPQEDDNVLTYEYLKFDPFRIQNLLLEKESVQKMFMEQEGEAVSFQFLWNKVYKKSLLDRVIKELSKFEGNNCDLIIAVLLWMEAKKVSNIHSSLYFYYQKKQDTQKNKVEYETYLAEVQEVKIAFDRFETILKKYKIFDMYQLNFINWKKLYVNRLYERSIKEDIAPAANNLLKSEFQIDSLSLLDGDKGFFDKSEVLDVSFWWEEEIKKYIVSDACEYVSFDIFDTLIERPFLEPTDLFYLMSQQVLDEEGSKSYFDVAHIRIESERSCREKMRVTSPSIEEVTLDEIYLEMKNSYCIGDSAVELMKKREIELELEFCSTRAIGKELYQLAVFLKKKILITSDMYLQQNIIEKILEKNGYKNYSQLYLSSSIRLGKWSGNLFKYIIKDLSIKDSKKICHIGDNWESDVVMAQKAGLQAFHISKATDLFKNSNPCKYTGESYSNIFSYNNTPADAANAIWGFPGIRMMLGVVANKLFGNPFIPYVSDSDFNANPCVVGYYALGMHLFAVAHWLLEENTVAETEENRLHFVARDGYILKQVYDEIRSIYPQAPKSNYLHLSRKALAMLDVYQVSDLYSLINKMNVYNSTPMKVYLMMFPDTDEVKKQDFLETCRKNGIQAQRKFASVNEFYGFISYLDENVLDKNVLLYEERRLKVTSYFKNLIKKGDILFDVGYSGRAEAALTQMLGFAVNSYYIHSNSEVLNIRSKDAGFITKLFYDYKPTITGIMREHMMMELAPSTVGYKEVNGTIVPMFEKYNLNYPSTLMTKLVQESAVEFTRDMVKYFGGYMHLLNYRNNDVSRPFEYYLQYSKFADREIFSELPFEDEFGEGRKLSALDFWEGQLSQAQSNGNSYVLMGDRYQGTDIEVSPHLIKLVKVINKVFPYGSKRRNVIKTAVKKVINRK